MKIACSSVCSWAPLALVASLACLPTAVFAQAAPPGQALAVPDGYTATPAPPAPPPGAQPYAQTPQAPVYAQQPQAPVYAQQPYAPLAPAAAIDQPRRSGFTLELGLGVAMVSVPELDASRFGLHGLTIGLGGFVSSSVALEARITGATLLDDGAGSLTFSTLLFGVQYWASDIFMLGAGIGAAVVRSDFASEMFFGIGLDVRAGLAFARWSSGEMRVALDFAAGLIDGTVLAMYALALEYQYY